MKIHVPFTVSDFDALTAKLLIVGFGELRDTSGREFTLYRDQDKQRFVLTSWGMPQAAVIDFAKLLAAVLLGGRDELDHVAGAAAVELQEETRKDAPTLLPIFDAGENFLHVAINGWAVAVERPAGVVNIDVRHLATMIVAAASAPVTPPKQDPPAVEPLPSNLAAPIADAPPKVDPDVLADAAGVIAEHAQRTPSPETDELVTAMAEFVDEYAKYVNTDGAELPNATRVINAMRPFHPEWAKQFDLPETAAPAPAEPPATPPVA